jgi:hypothetical protein
MKDLKYLLIIAGIIIWFITIYIRQKDDIERLQANQTSLINEHDTYVELTSKELSKQTKIIDSLKAKKINPKDVKVIVDTEIEYETDTVYLTDKDTIYLPLEEETYKYTHKFECFEIEILSKSDPTILPIKFEEARIQQIVYQKRVRFLGITLWKKPIKVEVTNNCGFKISSEIINIVE